MAIVLILKVGPVDKTGVCSHSNSIKQGYAVMSAMSCPRAQGQQARADSSPGARAFLSHSECRHWLGCSACLTPHRSLWFVNKAWNKNMKPEAQ